MKIKQWISRIVAPIRRFFRRLWNGRHVISDLVKHKHRFVVLDTDTYKEKISFSLSGINLFVFLGITALVLILLTSILLAFTPLREFIPGYTNTEMVEQTYENARIIDSLEQHLAGQEALLADIQDVLAGKDPALRHSSETSQGDSVHLAAEPYSRTAADSLLREEIEALGGQHHFALPLKGRIEKSYSNNYPGIDISSTEDNKVRAIQSGVVLWAEAGEEGEYTMVVQHLHDMIALYRGNGKPQKKVGDDLESGEPLMQLKGGTEKKPSQLHLELRKEGHPVNPKEYLQY